MVIPQSKKENEVEENSKSKLQLKSNLEVWTTEEEKEFLLEQQYQPWKYQRYIISRFNWHIKLQSMR